MTNAFINEASALASKTVLSKAEQRRFSFLLIEINEERNAQRKPSPQSKAELRSRLLADLKEIGIKRGHREKVVDLFENVVGLFSPRT